MPEWLPLAAVIAVIILAIIQACVVQYYDKKAGLTETDAKDPNEPDA